VFVDEAASVVHPSFVGAVGRKHRKNGLGGIYLIQDLADFDDARTASSLLNNTGTKVALAAALKPSTALANELSPNAKAGSRGAVTGGDIADLPNYSAYIRAALETGEKEIPPVFSVDLLPPAETFDKAYQGMSPEQQREHLAQVRAKVETKREQSRRLLCNQA
jgi:hypothetical protein